MFIIFFPFLLHRLNQHFLSDMLFATAFLNSHSDSLSDRVHHRALFIGIPFKHTVNFWLRNNKLYLAEEIFSHGSVSMVEAFNGLDVGCNKFVEQISAKNFLVKKLLKFEHSIDDFVCYLWQ